MAARITRSLLESAVMCRYKTYPKLQGEYGSRSEYEIFLAHLRENAMYSAVERIRSQYRDGLACDVALTTPMLKQGTPCILGAEMENDIVSLSFDGLKKVSGFSKLGSFHYLPMIFHGGARVGKDQRLLLELHALLLAPYQGKMPDRGIVWYGREAVSTTVRLNPDPRTARQILADLRRMSAADTQPPLILNDHCRVCEFRERCRNQAIQDENLSLLGGIKPKEITAYSRKGILTLTQLAHTFRPRRPGRRARPRPNRRAHALQALALRDGTVYVLNTPALPQSPVHIYLDIETDPDVGFTYLIGLIVVQDGIERRLSFWADAKNQEADIFAKFVHEVISHEEFIVFCYGSHERDFLTRMRKAVAEQSAVDRILDRLVNVLTIIYNHVYFPTYSNSLKEIAKYLGIHWADVDADGLQSILWRHSWEDTADPVWKFKLLTYNMDDCMALKRVTETLKQISNRVAIGITDQPADVPCLSVTLVEDLDRLSDYRPWRRVNFVHHEYEAINKCAYFDYQRQRVYVRTGKMHRKRGRQKAPSPNRKIPATTRIVTTVSRCPGCNSPAVIAGVKKQIRTQEPRVKRAFDIAATATGLRRRVVECRTTVHRCLTCGVEFVPEQHERIDRHFHGLKSWAMFQHVTYRVSLESVCSMIEEFFGFRVFPAEMQMIKTLMAQHYEETYGSILQKILSGHILHVDETEVQLKSGKGYVWVLTSLEDVVYMYRPSRAGEFLKDLLYGFSGVLVSDFYSAYDGMKCAQQKCLIHLMRDMNQELLNQPFDDDLKAITIPFGVLLRQIVTTIDEHGLSRYYLKQHRRHVDDYFHTIQRINTTSEACRSLQERLLQYRFKLFTFLDYDGVSWNNNNAEHAIKQFAYYRELTTGMLTETGINDYLRLLSIQQTCRYKGVSFLRFLLSKEVDVDSFRRRTHRRRPPSSIELYPDGFVPPHLASARQRRERAPGVESIVTGAGTDRDRATGGVDLMDLSSDRRD
jgi:predicted RecB family nuclease